jgi:hypothetical protein
MFDNPLVTLLVVSFVFGAPLGWLAWHRGYPRRAAWVWATIPMGIGLPLGIWAVASTREPLVPWLCPACQALTRASQAHTIDASTGMTLAPSGPGIAAVTAGLMAGSAALVTATVAAATASGVAAWALAAGFAAAAAALISWGRNRAGHHDTPRLLIIGYSCRACGQQWEVRTDPDEGPNQAGAAIVDTAAFDDTQVIDGLVDYLTTSQPYDVADHMARWDAVRAIAATGGTKAVEALIMLLDDETLADAVIGALASLSDARAVEPLTRVLRAAAVRSRDADPIDSARGKRHCVAAADALGRIGDARAAEALGSVAGDPANPPSVRDAARRAGELLHHFEAA